MFLPMQEGMRFIDVLDMDLAELLDSQGGLFSSQGVATYHKVLIAYLTGDNLQLRRYVDGMPAGTADERVVLELALLRLRIREDQVDAQAEDDLLRLTAMDHVWSGEVHFALGVAAEQRRDDQRAHEYYLRAAGLFREIGVRKKAVRAAANAVAAESRMYPERRFLPQLHFIYREAKRVADYSTAAQALMNISSEYFRLGAQGLALKLARRALAVAARNSGNLAHGRAQLHLCFVLAELRRFSEAREYAEVARASDFAEIRQAAGVLIEKFETQKSGTRSQRDKQLTMFWSQHQTQAPTAAMTRLEQIVVAQLAEGARSREELIRCLYGDKISLQARENRLFNLLNRLRRQHGLVIHCKQGMYQLLDAEAKSPRQKSAK